jgi:hypothetical protein
LIWYRRNNFQKSELVAGLPMESMACTASPPKTPNPPGRGRAYERQQGRTMEKPTEEQIRQRAHEIWERHHRPHGREDEFWHQAEKELQEAHDPEHTAHHREPSSS